MISPLTRATESGHGSSRLAVQNGDGSNIGATLRHPPNLRPLLLASKAGRDGSPGGAAANDAGICPLAGTTGKMREHLAGLEERVALDWLPRHARGGPARRSPRDSTRPEEGEMPNYTYLIVGGGMTADAAIHGIREIDRGGSIGVIGAESHPPYNRPPLSKGLWKKQRLDSIWRKSDTLGVTFHLGLRVQHLDPANKRVTDDQGNVYTFDKLLLATGSTPR